MRRIGLAAAIVLAGVVLGAGPIGPARAQTPAALAAPANVRIENVYNPLPPDLLTIPKVVRWNRVAAPGVNYRVALTLPPRDGPALSPLPENAVARVADSEPPEYRFEYAPWRGPYCFRVAALYPDGQESNAEPVCIAKQTDDSPFDVHDLSIGLQASLRGFVITWGSHFYRGEFSVQKALKPSSAETHGSRTGAMCRCTFPRWATACTNSESWVRLWGRRTASGCGRTSRTGVGHRRRAWRNRRWMARGRGQRRSVRTPGTVRRTPFRTCRSRGS